MQKVNKIWGLVLFELSLIILAPLFVAYSWGEINGISQAIDQIAFYLSRTFAGVLITFWLYPLWLALLYFSISGRRPKNKEKNEDIDLLRHTSIICLIVLPLVFYRFGVLPAIGE